jgi:cell wall-associated NlpC family hydrolase
MKGRKHGTSYAQPALKYLRPGPRQAARGRLGMRHDWLARAVLAAAAASVPVATLAAPALTAPAQAATDSQQTTVSASSTIRELALTTQANKKAPFRTYNQVAASVAMTLVGDPYAYGGTSPAGFDCSGLSQWVYRNTGGGKPIPRMAEDQFLHFRPISHTAARPGDLVFFHDTSYLGSYVYHVGVYEGGDMMVAATDPGGGVQYQSFTWAGDTVSFGTITH